MNFIHPVERTTISLSQANVVAVAAAAVEASLPVAVAAAADVRMVNDQTF